MCIRDRLLVVCASFSWWHASLAYSSSSAPFTVTWCSLSTVFVMKGLTLLISIAEILLHLYASSSPVIPIKVLRILAYRTSSMSKSTCLLYTSPSPRDRTRSRMPSSA
eukprot:TRINITY_DN18909_c0_g1_i4.p2 TRINITY_DN18909_c0_g1~~TRINITY_DN18909_c0_g1_i4.p2  ORF type:complete len:108 (-),score=20.70 TRINITY_DN18909_c0_g1_i4:48-371(-)